MEFWRGEKNGDPTGSPHSEGYLPQAKRMEDKRGKQAQVERG